VGDDYIGSRRGQCRDYISAKVCNLKHAADERAVDLKIEKLDVRLDAMDKALVIRTAELEARLYVLNQLRADVIRDRDLFVRKDMFDAALGLLNNLKQEYVAAHQILINRVTVIETRSLTWAAVLVVLFGIVEVISHFWKSGAP
jgi:hypothetical protein